LNIISIISIIISGALYVLAFSPFDYKILMYFSIVLSHIVFFGSDRKDAMKYGYLYGLVIFSLGASWIFISIYNFGGKDLFISSLITIIFILIQSSYFLLYTYFVNLNLLNQNRVIIFLFPASLWVLMEFARSNLLTGFPWLLVGVSQIHTIYDNIFPIFGTLSIGFIMVFLSTNLSLFFIQKNKKSFLIVVLSTFLILNIFSNYDFKWTKESSDKISVGIMQPNIEQDFKFKKEGIIDIRRTLLSLSNNTNNDFLILPETVMPLIFREDDKFYKELLKNSATNVISGIFRQNNEKVFNSLVLINDNVQYYDKRHLVPFGEYTPMKSILYPISRLLSIPMSNLSSGQKKQKNLVVDNINFIPLICYESAYPELIDMNGMNHSVILNVSNDSWFGDSLAPYQHLQISQVRALEFKRYLIRAANTGISAIIDKDGHILEQLNLNTRDLLQSHIKTYTGKSLYSRFGDYPILMLIFISIIFYFIKRKADG